MPKSDRTRRRGISGSKLICLTEQAMQREFKQGGRQTSQEWSPTKSTYSYISFLTWFLLKELVYPEETDAAREVPELTLILRLNKCLLIFSSNFISWNFTCNCSIPLVKLSYLYAWVRLVYTVLASSGFINRLCIMVKHMNSGVRLHGSQYWFYQ